MEIDTNILTEKIKKLFNQKRFEKVIELLSDGQMKAIAEKKEKDAVELYIWRGNAKYEQKDYDGAISNYNKALEIDPYYGLAFYNRTFALIGKGYYLKAIENCDKVINLCLDYNVDAYVIKGAILRAINKYREAIKSFDKAIDIDPDYANAYFNRGIAKKESNIDLLGSRQDFEKFIELTDNKNDKWVKYANYYIEEINELNDKELSNIINIVTKIKKQLLIEEDYITHYTSLSVLKSLILGKNKFRLSEGNFMNDPSEGKEFFNFLEYSPYDPCKEDGSCSENFSPKPFIGSFVTKDKSDDLNMWRFYGKDEGIEAKGCAITLHINDFIEEIDSSLPKGEEDYCKYESDIHFYRVVYLKAGSTDFSISHSKNSNKLETLMRELKSKVKSYKAKDKTSLEKYLNSIAFLFKSDVYRNEDEVRLVVKGMEFEKKYNMDIIPPRVYIELESIKNSVEQITLGPKVDKASEWASAFYYSYELKAPKIMISHLPYK